MGDHADPRRVERVGGHARRGHSLGERIGGREIRIDVEEHDVRSNAPDRILALEWESRGEAGERTLSESEDATPKALGYLD